jgi:hypothetical protein
VAEPTVRELLIDRIDVHCRLLTLELDQVRKATEQLAPERARSCRNAITMASVMIDEIRLRAHARPPDTDELSFPPDRGGLGYAARAVTVTAAS